MEINNDRTLEDLQRDFTSQFPYLKIVFYNSIYKSGKSRNETDLLDPKQQLCCVRQQDEEKSGIIELDEDMPIQAFEELMWREYGLHIQVFRKAYGKWYPTWASSDWSLKDQNQRSGIMGNKNRQLKITKNKTK